MDRRDLEQRMKCFALGVIRCTESLPKTRSNDVISRQILRSAFSIGSNYREAGRAESRSDFVHKIGIAAKEAAETEYWLDLLVESNTEDHGIAPLLKECRELLAIMVTSGKTARAGQRR